LRLSWNPCRASLPNPRVPSATLVRARGQYLGRVEARDAEAAIEKDEARRSRLIAQPVE